MTGISERAQPVERIGNMRCAGFVQPPKGGMHEHRNAWTERAVAPRLARGCPMQHRHADFFDRAGPFTLRQIAEHVGATLAPDADGTRPIEDVRPLSSAGPSHLAFFDNRRYAEQLTATEAGACLVNGHDACRVPARAAVLTTPAPYAAFALALQLFYADALRSKAAAEAAGANSALVHPSARIDEGVVVEPGAVVGREAVIGRGTTVAAGAVVGYRVVLGRDCYVGACASLTHAVVGDRVIIHAGARIGQDGFGFAVGSGGRLKVPQVGCVLIGDDVEIGANTTIDRGTLADTVIGEGTKIDNLVQVAHNVVIGRQCIIVAQSGIAGSAELGDYVVMGAKSGVIGHVKVGRGAQIAGMCHVKDDVAPGAKMGGTPGRPFKEWAREVAAVRLLGRRAPAAEARPRAPDRALASLYDRADG
jgi:UDP-3-O-[3-hydroxymyristoyl] glucosamine N-acyltransferase